jgi:hypothetical protein
MCHAHHAPGANPVLDIGGEVGALVVYLAALPATDELYAHPAGQPDHEFHTGVHTREVDGQPTWVAIFPTVREGHYYLLDDDHQPMAAVTVVGGQVEHADLRLTSHSV